MNNLTFDDVESIARVIQVALTPVFLLTGIASLLGVLSTRLGRVADRVDTLTERLETAGRDERQRLLALLNYLRRRSVILDIAVMFAVLAGVATCVSALLLFVGSLRDLTGGAGLLFAFGMALVLTVGALACYLLEMLLAGRGIRVRVRRAHDETAEGSADAEPGEDQAPERAPGP
jgi:Protein of unknown function (DUF2721)